MRSRDATATINGFRYQFLRTIEALIDAHDGTNIVIEGIEDIDIITADNVEFLQCKYYEETSYKPSLLKKPIKLMLMHFATNKDNEFKYHLYIYFKKNADQLPCGIEGAFIDEIIASGSQNDDKILSELSDEDVKRFIGLLEITLGEQIDKKIESIKKKMQTFFEATQQNVETFLFDKAISLIVLYATKKTEGERTLTPDEFRS